MTTKPTRWLARRLGRRGAAQAILGVIFILVGLDVFLGPARPPDMERFLLHTFIPTPLMALLWIVPGLLALWASTHKTGPDGFGFNALVIPVILRVVSYLFSFVAFLFGYGSSPSGLASALIWTAILALILIIAGWAEVPSTPRRRKGRRYEWK